MVQAVVAAVSRVLGRAPALAPRRGRPGTVTRYGAVPFRCPACDHRTLVSPEHAAGGGPCPRCRTSAR